MSWTQQHKRVRTSFDKLMGGFKRLFYYGNTVDQWLPEIMLAPYVSVRWRKTPLWLRIIAPPSCGKTAHLSLLSGQDLTYEIDEITSKSFASGFRDTSSTEYSKLPQFDGHVLIISDESTLMEQRQEERNAIQAVLRRCYDGKFSKVFGNLEEKKEFTFFFNLIAAATPQIDRYFLYTQALGERYLNYRLQIPNRDALAKRAFDNQFTSFNLQHKKLNRQVIRFLDQLPVVDVRTFDIKGVREQLLEYADFITKIRTRVLRDATGNQITALPQIEAGGRLVQQLTQVVIADTILHGSLHISDASLEKAKYLALCSLPTVNVYILWNIYTRHEQLMKDRASDTKLWFRSSDMVIYCAIGRATVVHLLEDFSLYGLVSIRKGVTRGGRAIEYRMKDSVYKKIKGMGLFRYYLPPAHRPGTRKDRSRILKKSV